MSGRASAYHLIVSGVPGLPGRLCLALGGLVGVWEQVGLHVGVGVRPLIGHLHTTQGAQESAVLVSHVL